MDRKEVGRDDRTGGSQKMKVLQFIRSGRIAITKSKIERLSDILEKYEERWKKTVNHGE